MKKKKQGIQMTINVSDFPTKHPKLFKDIINRLKQYYKFTVEYDAEKPPLFLTLWENGKAYFDSWITGPACMACMKERPITFKMLIDNFEQLVIKNNGKLYNKLLHQAFVEANDNISGLYTYEGYKKLRKELKKVKHEK